MEKLKIPIPEKQLAEFCNRWQIEELSFFGSALRDDFNPESDIDVLISSTPNANWSLFDHLRMEQELSNLLNRKIDLYTRQAVEKSHNWMRREEILRTAEVIHGAR